MLEVFGGAGLRVAAGDAFETDQTDRDLSRDFQVPSAPADGH